MRANRMHAAVTCGLVALAILSASGTAASAAGGAAASAGASAAAPRSGPSALPTSADLVQPARLVPGAVPKAAVAVGTVIHRVWVSVLSVTDTTDDDQFASGLSDSNISNMVRDLDTFWRKQSDNHIGFVLAGIEARSLHRSECVPSDLFADVPPVAFDGHWYAPRNHLMLLTRERVSCNSNAFAGNATNMWGSVVFSPQGTGSVGTPVLEHEMGHNLTFLHAESSICNNTKTFDGPVASFAFDRVADCQSEQYGDDLDIMGPSVPGVWPNLSAPQRILAGWMTGYAKARKATGATTVTLRSLDEATGVRAIRITDPVSGQDYYVEYRTATGDNDAYSGEFSGDYPDGYCTTDANSGYTKCRADGDAAVGEVRILRPLAFYYPDGSYYATGTTVLAVGLTGDGIDRTRRTQHLSPGQQFRSATYGFAVKVNSADPVRGASITVTFPTRMTPRVLPPVPPACGASPASSVAPPACPVVR